MAISRIMLPLGLVALTLATLVAGCRQSETPPATETSGETPAAQTPATPGEPVAEAKTQLVNIPLGLPPLPIPEDNPMTAEKIELGKLL